MKGVQSGQRNWRKKIESSHKCTRQSAYRCGFVLTPSFSLLSMHFYIYSYTNLEESSTAGHWVCLQAALAADLIWTLSYEGKVKLMYFVWLIYIVRRVQVITEFTVCCSHFNGGKWNMIRDKYWQLRHDFRDILKKCNKLEAVRRCFHEKWTRLNQRRTDGTL